MKCRIVILASLVLASLAVSEVRAQSTATTDPATQAATTAPATDPAALALKAGDAQKANMAQLQTYRWRVKTDMQSAGVSKANVVNEISFDADGKIKATPISGETTEEQKRGLRGRSQEKEMSELADYLGKVTQQSLAYMYMSKGTLVDMFEKATITTEGDATKITAKDVYVKGDQVVMTLDSATMLTRHLTFTSLMGADAISGDVTYAALKDGTVRVTNSTIDVPAKGAKIISESFDFVKPEN